MKTAIASAVALGLLGASLAPLAGAQELYRWVDENRKVFYSDTPPPANIKYFEQKRPVDNIIEQDKVPYATRLAMQNSPVVLYANDCPRGCEAARAFLGKRGIPFADRNPQKDPVAAKALIALAGALEVPTLSIGAGKLSGFNESEWSVALDEAGYPRANANLRATAATTKAPADNADKAQPMPAEK
jgi:glutaredoxin